MIYNQDALLIRKPIKDILTEKVAGPVSSHGLTEAGYDIRIKQDVHFTSAVFGGHRRAVVTVDQANQQFGRFTLASAIEEFQMPADLVGIVHDKSTWARKGLSVFNTVIEPGWNGFLTLELVYHGQEDLFIPAGSGIAQVLFHPVARPAVYNGKYQNQEDKPVAAR